MREMVGDGCDLSFLEEGGQGESEEERNFITFTTETDGKGGASESE